MIDISDGLAQDLHHILEESKVGAVIYERLIPKSKHARSFNEALYMGEDFQLLFSLTAKEAKRLRAAIIMKKINFRLSAIGEITGRKFQFSLIKKNNQEIKLSPKGFRHF